MQSAGERVMWKSSRRYWPCNQSPASLWQLCPDFFQTAETLFESTCWSITREEDKKLRGKIQGSCLPLVRLRGLMHTPRQARTSLPGLSTPAEHRSYIRQGHTSPGWCRASAVSSRPVTVVFTTMCLQPEGTQAHLESLGSWDGRRLSSHPLQTSGSCLWSSQHMNSYWTELLVPHFSPALWLRSCVLVSGALEGPPRPCPCWCWSGARTTLESMGSVSYGRSKSSLPDLNPPKSQGSKLPRLAAVQTGVDVKGEVGAVPAQALFCRLRVWKDCPFPGTQVCWMDLQCLFQLGTSWVKSALLNTGVRDLCRMNQFSSTF